MIPSPAKIDAARQKLPGKNTPVILYRTTRKGRSVPKFGADEWDLACISHAPKTAPTLQFSSLTKPWQMRLAKELIWQRLNVPVASMRATAFRPKSWAGYSCKNALGCLKLFFKHLDSLRVDALCDVEPRHLTSFAELITTTHEDKAYQAQILKCVDYLWESREHFSDGGLSFPPWPDQSSFALTGGLGKPVENRTPRIPEAVLGGLLSWSLAYIDHFADDIIAAERFHRGLDRPRDQHRGRDSLRIFQAYLEAEVAGSGVPAIRHLGGLVPSNQLICLRAGISNGWLRARVGQRALGEAIAQHGLNENCLPEPRFRIAGAGKLWRSGMSIRSMKAECRHLSTACYIVCAYLSGMRDDEVQDLRRDCLETVVDERGRPYRFRLHGRTFKDLAQPKPVSWVVIEPVKRAIDVLLQLTGGLSSSNKETSLFVRLHRKSEAGLVLKKQINEGLIDFVAHCNDVLAPSLPEGAKAGEYNLRRIPDGPDGPWPIAPIQFRRTIAWHIANRPFGVIAGMIQYKHASIQMFEGYAGVSASDFRAEILQEEEAARRLDIIEMYEDSVVGVLPAGPMASELKGFFSAMAAELGPLPCRVEDNDRAAALVQMKAHQLYPGLLAHCFYVPSQARCHKNATPAEEKREPVYNLCDPDCPNACWTRDHLPGWLELEDETKTFSKLNRVSPLQRDILKDRLKEVSRRVRAIEEATGASQIGD